jgi:hypothetical protein
MLDGWPGVTELGEVLIRTELGELKIPILGTADECSFAWPERSLPA